MAETTSNPVPRVSVLMPVYNAQRYLAQAVESVLAQTWRDFELIVINDGSTDESEAMLRRYAAADSRVRLVSRPNTGYVVALNEMIGLARGDLLARMDADDVCLPARFERQVAYMDQHPECAACGCRVQLIDADGDALRDMSASTTHEQIDAAHLAGRGGEIAHPAAMIRASAMRKVGGYRTDLAPAEDLDLFLRLGEVGSLANLPDRLLQYRVHLQSVGHTKRALQRANAARAVRDARQRRGLPDVGAPPDTDSPVDPAAEQVAWAWWALAAGNRGTSRKHAARALRQAPWRAASWKVYLCALRGY